jgi:hypothetical protein
MYQFKLRGQAFTYVIVTNSSRPIKLVKTLLVDVLHSSEVKRIISQRPEFKNSFEEKVLELFEEKVLGLFEFKQVKS